jgi:hypothetical protein
MDELWPYMDEITYWLKTYFCESRIIHSSEIDNMINGVDLMDDDMKDEGDHHPYKLKFMVDSICLIKIHHNQVCLIHVFDKISSMMSKICPNSSFPSLWFEV